MENLSITINTSDPDFLEKLKMDEDVSCKATKSNNTDDKYDFFQKRKSHVRKRRRKNRNHKASEINKNKGTVPHYKHDKKVTNIYFKNKASEPVNKLINRGMKDYFEEKEYTKNVA